MDRVSVALLAAAVCCLLVFPVPTTVGLPKKDSSTLVADAELPTSPTTYPYGLRQEYRNALETSAAEPLTAEALRQALSSGGSSGDLRPVATSFGELLDAVGGMCTLNISNEVPCEEELGYAVSAASMYENARRAYDQGIFAGLEHDFAIDSRGLDLLKTVSKERNDRFYRCLTMRREMYRFEPCSMNGVSSRFDSLMDAIQTYSGGVTEGGLKY